jgi:hypothetical protein
MIYTYYPILPLRCLHLHKCPPAYFCFRTALYTQMQEQNGP